jgi:predicted adenylyl cyclase CyaB
MSDNLFTIKQVAKELGVHWQSVRNYLDRGDLQSVRIGRLIKIKKSDLEDFINNSKKIDKTIEIELRYKVKDFKEVQKALIDQNAELIQQTHIIDHWFIPVSIKNMAEEIIWFDKKRNTAVRIREYINDYGKQISTSLETKRLTLAMNHDTFIETKTNVESYQKAKDFLEMIDRKEYLLIDKNRMLYQVGEYEVVLDNILNYGTGMEIEYHGPDTNREKIILKLQSFASSLGLDESMRFEKSLTVDSMQVLAKF